jgi:anthrone oxygenase-like protein
LPILARADVLIEEPVTTCVGGDHPCRTTDQNAPAFPNTSRLAVIFGNFKMIALTIRIIRFINVILAALLAGVSFGIWLGFNPANLTASSYLEQQQNTIRSLSTLMTSLVVVASVITITSAFIQRKSKAVSLTLLTAALFFIACILVSAFGNKPIDNIIMTWTSNSLPNNWSNLRDKWWSLHIIRTFTELIALVLITWTSISKDK